LYFADLDFGGNVTGNAIDQPLFDIHQDAPFVYKDESTRATLDIDYEFDNGITFSSLTGFQAAETQNDLDVNGGIELPRYWFRSGGEIDLWSQEFNLISPDDQLLAAEGVLRRMSAPTGQTAPFPAGAWPTETFHQRRSYMRLNGEGIETLWQPAAHSDGDSLVFFRQSDVVMAGDVLDATAFPVIDIARGGSVQGEIDALNKLVELAIPNFPLVWQEGGTLVVPGHGHVYEQLDVVEYRDMITIIRDRVQAMVNKGLTLEQVKAAAPTQGYTRRYGSDSGPWTTSMFVEAVYRSLGGKEK
jgi:glyoxylase-like metal-dependent hydrolase (beta-lactamase superfamily II)